MLAFRIDQTIKVFVLLHSVGRKNTVPLWLIFSTTTILEWEPRIRSCTPTAKLFELETLSIALAKVKIILDIVFG